MRLEKPNQIDKSEVLRYLRYNSETNVLTSEMNVLVEQCITEVLEACVPRAVITDMLNINLQNDEIYLENTNITFSGTDILKHLENCDRVLLFAVTLGQQLDRFLTSQQLTDMTKYVIADSCANVLIEHMADIAQQIILEKVTSTNSYMTSRYSAGYGDFDVLNNIAIIDVLNAEKIAGIYATKTGCLTPKKSTTAIVGVSNIAVTGHLAGCTTCAMRKTCDYKKGGSSCGF